MNVHVRIICRFDRDQYVRIETANIGPYAGAFAKFSKTKGLGVKYDYTSVMHYSQKVRIYNANIMIR